MEDSIKIRADKRQQPFIDICKGIGIIAVVFGHIYDGTISKVMYMFHMPLFFFIAGFLFSHKPDLKKFLCDKAFQLLIPYFGFLLAIYSYMSYLFFQESSPSLKEILIFFSRPFLGGLWLSGYATVFWFVPVFFFTQQIFNLIVKFFSQLQQHVIMISLIVLAYINQFFFIRLPLDFNVILMALPLVYFGNLFKGNNKIYPFFTVLIVLVISFVGILLVYLGFNNFMDMKRAYYGIPFVTLISALATIISMFIFSKLLVNLAVISTVLSYIGKASMVIMYMHQPLQLLIAKYITSDAFLRASLSILISLLLFEVFKKNLVTRIIFLGSKADFKNRFKNHVLN